MDQQTSVADVVSALQSILSTANLPTRPRQAAEHDDKLPASRGSVLPRDVPPGLAHFKAQSRLVSSALRRDEAASALTALASHLSDDVLPFLNAGSLSPNYYGFVTGGATPAALLGDLLAAVYDQNVAVHLPRETLATTLEVATLDLLVQLFRLPRDEWAVGEAGPGGGTFTTGATASNVLGLAMGREYVLRKALQRRELAEAEEADLSCGECGIAELMAAAGVTKIQVLSTLPHSSMAKAASIVGLGRRNVVSISEQGDPLQIDLARLEEEARKANVLNILAISAGEVNTGRFATNSLDQMTTLRRLCDDHGIWMHVDGAFGLFGRVLDPDDTEHGTVVQGVQGLELADSITGDCHKLLNVPYDSGLFFTRHKSLSEHVFGNGNAAYLTSAGAGDGIPSPLNIGIENSRRFRALPAYCTLTAYGRQGYTDMLKRQIGLARRVTRWLLRDGRFEVLTGGANEAEVLAKTFIVILFRLRRDEANADLVRRVNATGRIYLSGTFWEGRPAARIAVSNWQVDVERDGALVEEVLSQVAEGRS